MILVWLIEKAYFCVDVKMYYGVLESVGNV
jgi:hypothetical protein